MSRDLLLKIMDDGKVDMRDLSMCIERAMGEIKAQGLDEERQDRLINIGMISVNTVMLSFALELALKGALQSETNKPARTHDLKKLYESLTKEGQDRIKEEWGKQFILSKETRDMGPLSFFSRHREDFTKWRYLESPRLIMWDHDMYGAIMAVNSASYRKQPEG